MFVLLALVGDVITNHNELMIQTLTKLCNVRSGAGYHPAPTSYFMFYLFFDILLNYRFDIWRAVIR